MRKLLPYLEDLRASGVKGFIPYLLAGFPSKKWTVPLMEAAARAGATAIELGVPFSDPMADGPVLQKANFKALQNGVALIDVLEMVHRTARNISIPILLMGYANPFLQRGWERLAKEASAAGVSGFIVADFPAEESVGVREILADHDLGLVYFSSPTTRASRMRIIEKSCTGFVYLVAAKGVTGARENLSNELVPLLIKTKQIIRKPLYVGFGLSGPEQAREAAEHADGVIVGSRIAAFLEEREKSASLDDALYDYLVPWVKALNPW